MQDVQLLEAQAKLPEIVSEAEAGQPSIITRRGEPVAVVVGFDEWRRLSTVPSFGRLLMAAPLEPGDIEDRHPRPPEPAS